jgi:hypothetical protein
VQIFARGSKGRLENHTTAKIIKTQGPAWVVIVTLYPKNSGALESELARNTDVRDIPINHFLQDPTKISRATIISYAPRKDKNASPNNFARTIKIRSKRF